MKMKLCLCLLFSALALARGATAAQVTTEQFDAGANGWEGSVGVGYWDFSSGAAQVSFEDLGDFSFPDSATLSNQPNASARAFTGDYDAADISMIGFRFRADTRLPSGPVILEWGGGTSVFQRAFTVSQVGAWQTFRASLDSAKDGGWTAIEGSLADFDAARKAVKFVSIRVTRSGKSACDYRIDDLTLGHLPSAGALVSAPGAPARLRFDALELNTRYEMQTAADLKGPWSLSQSILVTNQTQWLDLTNDAPVLFWRLLLP